MNGPGASEASVLQVSSDTLSYQLNIPAKEVLYDKVLGSLVGSAIGDAMGAPTEMWTREDRQSSYGSVEALEPSAIDPSPEGIWDFHLPTGTTTDDTRWKSLVGNYLADNINNFYQPSGPDPYSFANHILNAYRDEVNQLRNISPNDPVDIEYKVRRLNWLQEWAMVAEPFAAKDLEGYTTSLHRFYGGDLLCAGMLYAPIIGLPYPGNPYQAYNAAHRLGIFDQGYARDITGLTAAMVAAAMLGDATPVSILEVFRTIDPHNYFRSRIFGREAFKTLRTAEYIAQSAKKLKQCNDVKPVYQWAKDSVKSCQIQTAFEMLDQRNQISPAHAQEILLVTLTSILFSDFDFRESMEFIVNYGRDNDTSGAVAGAILGAYLGYEQLPDDLKLNVVETNRENLGIDLQQLAATITDKITSARLYN
ncbi:MAG: hypothetical protein DHS20C17_24350 [Cyclobacteriaceae bacterium]|nr:MAG: hypothetical protein DHS20C17_24350 [Cyclobacteriaceae bacterium]